MSNQKALMSNPNNRDNVPATPSTLLSYWNITPQELEILLHGGEVTKHVTPNNKDAFYEYIMHLSSKGFGTGMQHDVKIERKGVNTYTIKVSL